ncbi:beta strand repeat-containing protein, partial [Microbulbifer mangrovi]|uniref:beta strand repeat-containing protein n=1 Tax=Microbulbifer mangrovi TaxID=927787 RepID=UPI0013012CEC
NGGSDSFQSAAGGDWVLAENLASVTHGGNLTVENIDVFTGGSGNIVGDGNSYFFDVDSGTTVAVANNVEFTGNTLTFNGISKVESDGELNALGLSGIYLKDDENVAAEVFADTASDDSGIKFIGLSNVRVSQIDTAQAGGIALSVVGNNSAELTDPTFSETKLEIYDLDDVIGASGNTLSSTGDWVVDGSGASNKGINFTGAWTVTSNGADLAAEKNIENNFSVNSEGYVGIHEMLFTDLVTVSPGGGSSASILDASGYEYGVVIGADNDSVALLTDAEGSTGTVFSGLSRVTTDFLSARDDAGTTSFSIKNDGINDYFDASSSNIRFYDLLTIQGTENGTEVVNWDDNWTLNGTAESGIYFSSSSGVKVIDFDTINTSGGTLDFNIGERFTIESDGGVTVGNTTFNDLVLLQKGSGFDGSVTGDPSLDASAFSNGLTLTDNVLEVVAGTLSIFGISSITANKVTASANAITQHDFVIGSSDGSQTVTVNEMVFSALQEVISDGNDSFSEETSGLAVLYLDDASGSDIYSHLAGAQDEPGFSVDSGILFSGFESTSVSTVDTNGQNISLDVNSTNNADLDSDAFTFTGLSSIEGAGSDQVTGSGTWTLDNGSVSNASIVFSGSWDVVAANGELQGSDAQETFTLGSDGALDVSGYSTFEFSGFTSVTAGASNDSVSSNSNVHWTLLDTDSAESSNGITFDGFSSIDTDAATLTGTAGDDTFTLTGSEADGLTLAYGGMSFTGLNEVDGNGSTYDAVTNPAGGDTLNATNNDD